ncbi:uncharacterized protein LOC127744825 isoform X2 [Arachis duranensis]|uniref:Uncharacterized protein LOC127744825 isoform X2 n=1 Tax=Arachis duranensis TaxID=130453 RepID=A0A9C6WPK4_ARADU|nr:uncharacterized protein LOC127744825 isoform X2 [Arachis duranensis]
MKLVHNEDAIFVRQTSQASNGQQKYFLLHPLKGQCIDMSIAESGHNIDGYSSPLRQRNCPYPHLASVHEEQRRGYSVELGSCLWHHINRRLGQANGIHTLAFWSKYAGTVHFVL